MCVVCVVCVVGVVCWFKCSDTTLLARVVSFLCNFSGSQSLLASQQVVRQGMEHSGGARRLGEHRATIREVASRRTSAAHHSQSPEQLRAAAGARVLRIQVSISALQPEDMEEMEAFQRAQAQRQMVVPPIDQQTVDTEEYVRNPSRNTT